MNSSLIWTVGSRLQLIVHCAVELQVGYTRSTEHLPIAGGSGLLLDVEPLIAQHPGHEFDALVIALTKDKQRPLPAAAHDCSNSLTEHSDRMDQD